MKHHEFPLGVGLPDAPLAMPTQVLERRQRRPVALLQMFLVWYRR